MRRLTREGICGSRTVMLEDVEAEKSARSREGGEAGAAEEDDAQSASVSSSSEATTTTTAAPSSSRSSPPPAPPTGLVYVRVRFV